MGARDLQAWIIQDSCNFPQGIKPTPASQPWWHTPADHAHICLSERLSC
jgi:hypothetical protein